MKRKKERKMFPLIITVLLFHYWYHQVSDHNLQAIISILSLSLSLCNSLPYFNNEVWEREREREFMVPSSQCPLLLFWGSFWPIFGVREKTKKKKRKKGLNLKNFYKFEWTCKSLQQIKQKEIHNPKTNWLNKDHWILHHF